MTTDRPSSTDTVTSTSSTSAAASIPELLAGVFLATGFLIVQRHGPVVVPQIRCVGVGAEIAALVGEAAWGQLRHPVRRVAARDGVIAQGAGLSGGGDAPSLLFVVEQETGLLDALVNEQPDPGIAHEVHIDERLRLRYRDSQRACEPKG